MSSTLPTIMGNWRLSFNCHLYFLCGLHWNWELLFVLNGYIHLKQKIILNFNINHIKDINDNWKKSQNLERNTNSCYAKTADKTKPGQTKKKSNNQTSTIKLKLILKAKTKGINFKIFMDLEFCVSLEKWKDIICIALFYSSLQYYLYYSLWI